MRYWAVKNDCNGVFSDTVSFTRADAEAKTLGCGSGAYVVPVLLLEVRETPDLHELREALGALEDGPIWGFKGWGG